MPPILNFLQHKQQKDEQLIEKLFQKAHSFNEKLEILLEMKQLQLDDHKLFLAFLAYLDEQGIVAEQLFRDVLELPKHQFEGKYKMKWAQVVKLACTFLVILKENDHEAYDAFVAK